MSPFERMNLSEVGKAMLVTGLVLLGSAAVLLFSAEARLRQTNEAVQRTTAALLRIDELSELVIGVDYSARGYALTGQQMFLQHEEQKQARLNAAWNELAGLVAPEQRKSVTALRGLIDIHASIYAKQVASGPSRMKEMAAIITNPIERNKRYEVINALSRLKTDTLQALDAEQTEAEIQLRHTSVLTFIIVGIAFLGGMTDVMARIWRTRRQRGLAHGAAAVMPEKS